MALELKVAQRTKAKLKLGMAAPSGGGKTLGALLIAYGLMKEKYPRLSDAELWAKIAIIDSENGSGELYVGKDIADIQIGEYNAVTLTPPFEADKYTNAVKLCADAGMEVAIIDSTTHLWSGAGGLLETQGNIAKRTGNSYTAWRDVTPQHTRFVDTMLQTDIHIIATMRSKTDYVQEKDANTGKTTVRKVGLNPIQKDGMEYEFTVFLDIDAEHNAFGSKDRTGIVDQKYMKITPDLGRQLMKWLESGTGEAKQVLATKVSVEEQKNIEVDNMEALKANVMSLSKKLVDDPAVGKEKYQEVLFKYTNGKPNPMIVKDYATMNEMYIHLKTLENKEN